MLVDGIFLSTVAIPAAALVGFLFKKNQDYEVRISVLEATIKDIKDDIKEIKDGVHQLVSHNK